LFFGIIRRLSCMTDFVDAAEQRGSVAGHIWDRALTIWKGTVRDALEDFLSVPVV
jgi:hypothetical protein